MGFPCMMRHLNSQHYRNHLIDPTEGLPRQQKVDLQPGQHLVITKLKTIWAVMETCLGDTLHRLEHQRGEYPLAVRIVVHHPPEEAWAHHQQVEDLVKMGELTHETSLVQEVGNKGQLQALCILGPR